MSKGTKQTNEEIKPSNLSSNLNTKVSRSSSATYVWAMRVFAVVYSIVGLLFFFMPDETFYLINIGPKVFKVLEEVPVSPERFWLVLSTSMMAMLVVTSLYSSFYP